MDISERTSVCAKGGACLWTNRGWEGNDAFPYRLVLRLVLILRQEATPGCYFWDIDPRASPFGRCFHIGRQLISRETGLPPWITYVKGKEQQHYVECI